MAAPVRGAPGMESPQLCTRIPTLGGRASFPCKFLHHAGRVDAREPVPAEGLTVR